MKKFVKADSIYLKKRQQTADKIGAPELFKTIDQFGLYAGSQTIGKAMAMYEIMKKINQVPGHIAEFGCWNGSNLLLMAKLLTLLQPNSIKKLYGFDSFEGLQTFASEDRNNGSAGDYKGNKEVLEAFISLFEMEDFVTLVVGNALNTIDEFAAQNKHMMLSLSYIDFDLYEPCKKALEFTHENLSVGGYIVFDEALTENWPGEGIAMKELLKKHPGCYVPEIIPFVRQPTVLLKRIK